MNGHHLIGSKQLKESTKHSSKSSPSSALYGEEQPNKKPIAISSPSYPTGQRNGAPSNSLTAKNSNKAKSIYSSHHLFPDAYHPHVHANQAAINYELSEKDKYVRKDKFSSSLTSFAGDKVNSPLNSPLNSTLNNSSLRNVKRKDERFRLDKPNRSTTAAASAGEPHHQLTNSSYKRFDEIKSNKSVDSPVTSSSPISEHYDFSSEESEANLPTNASSTNTLSKSTLNQSGSYSTPSPTAQCYSSSMESNCKLTTNRTRRCDEITIKNTKNLNSTNCTIAYQTSGQYRQPAKDYKVPRSASAQKGGKESLEQISSSKRSKEFGSKEFRVANKRKSMHEDDRDDGYVGDEMDNSRDSRYSRYGSVPHHDSARRTNNKLNSVQKLTSSSSASVRKQTTPSAFQNASLNQNENRMSQAIIKAKPTNSNGNKKPAASPVVVDQLTRTRKDELVSRDVDLSRETSKENIRENFSRPNPEESTSKEHTKDHSKDSQPPKEQIKTKEDKPVQRDDSKDSLSKVQKTAAATKPTPSAGQPSAAKSKTPQSAKLTSKTVESKGSRINEEAKETRKESREECRIETKEADESRREANERMARVKEDKTSAEPADHSENSSSQAQPEQSLESEKVNKSVNLKQNEMPIVYAFNLVETLVTSNLVRLKWTKNNGISITNLDRPNYQIEMIHLKREENGGQPIKCSRIVQQYSQKSCKVSNLISEQQYTFRVRLVYEGQLYLR